MDVLIAFVSALWGLFELLPNLWTALQSLFAGLGG